MVAVLKTLTARPVVKPRYTTLANDTFGTWYVRNEPALIEYWNALEEADREKEAGADCDFQEFAFVQYDIECELQAAARRQVYGPPDEGSTWDAETQMAYFGSDR